ARIRRIVDASDVVGRLRAGGIGGDRFVGGQRRRLVLVRLLTVARGGTGRLRGGVAGHGIARGRAFAVAAGSRRDIDGERAVGVDFVRAAGGVGARAVGVGAGDHIARRSRRAAAAARIGDADRERLIAIVFLAGRGAAECGGRRERAGDGVVGA